MTFKYSSGTPGSTHDYVGEEYKKKVKYSNYFLWWGGLVQNLPLHLRKFNRQLNIRRIIQQDEARDEAYPGVRGTHD